MKKTLLTIALGGLVLAGCSSNDQPAASSASPTDGLTVVASHYPVQFLVEQVGGDLVNVETLTAPGTEPHDLELTPSRSLRSRRRRPSSTSRASNRPWTTPSPSPPAR